MTDKQRAAAERRRVKGHKEYIRRIKKEAAKRRKEKLKEKER